MVCAESEQITVAVSANDLQAGDIKNRERHPVAIALRQSGVDDARVCGVSNGSDTTRQSPFWAKMAKRL
jgi:hypothetical protein